MVWLAAILAGLALWVGWAEAGPLTLEWGPSAGATSYTIDQSTDNGGTWAQVAAPLPSVCTGTPIRCAAPIVAPAAGLVLFRFSAVNSVGKTTRYSEGVWHCQSCAPPVQPAGVGVQ
jgi:hypothetical protein